MCGGPGINTSGCEPCRQVHKIGGRRASLERPGSQPRGGVTIWPAIGVGYGGQQDWGNRSRCLGHPIKLGFWGGAGFVGLTVWGGLGFVNLNVQEGPDFVGWYPGSGFVGEWVPSAPPTPAIVRELLKAIGALSARDSPAVDETKSAGEWSADNISIAEPANVDGDEDNFGSNKDIVEGTEFAGKPRLVALACCLDTWFRALERRTRSAVDRLLRDWEQKATADQQQFWTDANLIVVALQQKVAWASTLLQQMTTQMAEQRQLVDEKLANLACRGDKKLKEVDVAITSVSTSISLMEDSLTLATLALPTISDVKGWVTNVVATEQLAAGFPTAPPPNPPVAMVPSPCSRTEHGLVAMESNLAADSQARDAWAHAPWDPSLGINTELYFPAGKAWSDKVPDWNWRPMGGPHCNKVHLRSAGQDPEL